jgi:hypothetical protein
MEYKIEFRDFSILFNDESVRESPLDKSELNKWLKEHSLSEIKEFPYWGYSINEKVKYFRIIRSNDKNWNVYDIEKQDIVYFSFTCLKGIGFITDFEKKLKEKLEKEELEERRKKHPYSPLTTDDVVQVT